MCRRFSCQESSHERYPRSDSSGTGGLPLNRLDVDIPLWSIVRITRIGGDDAARSLDLDRGLHVNGHHARLAIERRGTWCASPVGWSSNATAAGAVRQGQAP